MDGYGDFFWQAAVIASAAALLAGAVVRRPVGLVILALVIAMLAGIFAYLMWLGGPDVSAGATIAGMTTMLLCPAVVLFALLGRGIVKIVYGKG